jgi:hypothetical protein
VFYLESCAFVSILNAWVAAASGRSIVFGDSTNGPACSNTTILGLEVENGSAPAYGIDCPNPASGTPTIVALNVRDSYFAGVGTEVINFGSKVNLSSAYLHGITTSASGSIGFNIASTLSYSFISCDAMRLTIGVSDQNKLIGSIQNWTFSTSHSGDSWSDCRPAANRTWTPNVAAIGSGITVDDTYSCVEGNVVDVTFTMQGTSISCAAGTLVTGLPFAPTFGGGFVNVFDTATSTSLGQGGVTATGLAMPAVSATSHVLTVTARYFMG